MIVPDVNVLLLAYDTDRPDSEKARDWWEQTLAGSRPVGLAWVTLLAFLRLTSNRYVFKNPWRVDRSISEIRSWLAQPPATILHPTSSHQEQLFGLIEGLGVGGNLTTDAHLAALALENQAELASTDADFSRFPGLRWFNPVTPA